MTSVVVFPCLVVKCNTKDTMGDTKNKKEVTSCKVFYFFPFKKLIINKKVKISVCRQNRL